MRVNVRLETEMAIDMRPDLYLRNGVSEWQETRLVFASTVGTPIHPRNMLRAFYKLLERAGLPHMRFHDLRHSCATLLAAQGVPPRVAMDILGHSDIRLTLNVYTHVRDESKRQAAEAMERLFGIEEKLA